MFSFRASRRAALLRAAVTLSVLAIAPVLTSASAWAQEFTMKIGFTTINDPFHEFAKRYAEEVQKRSDNRIKVEIFPAGQLGTAARQIEGLQFGTQEMFISPPGFLAGINPGFQAVDAPGQFKSMDHAHAVVTDPEFQEIYLNQAAEAGIRGVALWIYGPTAITSVKPIENIESVKGFKTRVLASPMEQKLAAALGMTGVSMDFTEALPALQTGTIDAVRTSLVVMGGMKFFDTAKYAIKEETGMIFSGAWVSQSWLDQLPADLKAIVIDTAHEMQDEGTKISKDFAAKSDKQWTDAGVTLVVLSDQERADLFAKVSPIGDEMLSTNERAAPAWNALKKALAKAPAN
ncbi:C4-dicarboxylate-binding protein DctP [Rhodoligotrophos appendicifer]|uniref:TRAP transporter substrate-binding protein n=1 Tax=Rhodoligotrophos appendicifer TaxID=987056 RepID=UPI00117D281D|nr:TRAP transporter substrate-binding protein [Rhodoligotrophos appendicifer]